MRSSRIHSTQTPHKTDPRFVPVKALLPGTNRFDVVKDPEESPTPESPQIFRNQTSLAARAMCSEIERVARRPYNILITGETGTGKTHTAREIHRRSARANKRFVELNCANLPEQLVEAELFGYRKGAFTGADRDHVGLFEEANGGILFLDEIGDIDPTIQNRLLKAIDEKQIKPLGTNQYVFCDVQIIAATSRNLPVMIENREFREDLYCRLAVLTIETTPLRERREDIPAMIALFLHHAADAINRPANQYGVYSIEEDALASLCECDYPGNIRALRNLVYELTSYVDYNEPISLQLAQFALAKMRFQKVNHSSPWYVHPEGSPDNCNAASGVTKRESAPQLSLLSSIVDEGDIILPVEVCVIRRGETFKQWTRRAKHCSVEAARQATGGSLRTAAERLGLTQSSLKGYLRRAKRAQNERLFDWQRESD